MLVVLEPHQLFSLVGNEEEGKSVESPVEGRLSDRIGIEPHLDESDDNYRHKSDETEGYPPAYLGWSSSLTCDDAHADEEAHRSRKEWDHPVEHERERRHLLGDGRCGHDGHIATTKEHGHDGDAVDEVDFEHVVIP